MEDVSLGGSWGEGHTFYLLRGEVDRAGKGRNWDNLRGLSALGPP